MAFELFKQGRKAKKDIKETEKREKYASSLVDSNDRMIDSAHRRKKADETIAVERAVIKEREKDKLNSEIRAARQNLYIQRERLINRVLLSNKEYKYIASKPDTPIKKRELARCAQTTKNAAYALAVVDSAIDRLDDIRTECEWRDIMRDLTKGYKMINAINGGSDLMTRLAFWIQKAKHDIKSDISVDAMEHYYGRPIDKLLEEQTATANAADILVGNSVLEMDDPDALLESVRWGTAFTELPGVVSNIAEQQSKRAVQNGGTPIIEKPEEIDEQLHDFSAMEFDDIPGMSGMI